MRITVLNHLMLPAVQRPEAEPVIVVNSHDSLYWKRFLGFPYLKAFGALVDSDTWQVVSDREFRTARGSSLVSS